MILLDYLARIREFRRPGSGRGLVGGGGGGGWCEEWGEDGRRGGRGEGVRVDLYEKNKKIKN